jgi:hypothetical protein
MENTEKALMRTNGHFTVYNKYIDPSTRAEVYQRAVILDVAWENRKAANVLASGGQMSADAATIYISFARGKNYLAPKAWQALASKTGKWTLQEGDVIVKGNVSDEIHPLVPAVPGTPGTPAVPAFTVTSLKAKYDFVMVISSVDTMDSGSPSMRHWRVGAK